MADDELEQRAMAAVERYLEADPRPETGVFLEALDPELRALCRELLRNIARMQALAPASATRVVAGRYALRDLLGSGGYGRVWIARDLRLDHDVALKELALRVPGGLSIERVFDSEKTALARLSLHGAARVRDAGNAGDAPFLVMDLVDGTPLHHVLRRLAQGRDGAPPTHGQLVAAIGRERRPGQTHLLRESRGYTRSVVRIVAQVLDTLQAVHECDVVHRDLKPSNVLLEGGGFPVIIDFGLASLRERAGEAGALCGTLNYLAPEQLRSESAGDDPRSDVYQAGLLLYEMLALRPAFDPRADTCPQRVLDGDHPPLRSLAPWVDAALEAICHTAMAADADRRFQSAEQFRRALADWLADQELPPWNAVRFEPLESVRHDPRLERWRGFDRLLGCEVFVEVPGRVLAQAVRQDFERVMRGIRALAQTESPRLLLYRGALLDDEGLPRLVLAARAGRFLDDVLAERGRLPVTEVVQIGHDLAEALHALHFRGHVHRDVGPYNVLIEADSGRAALAGLLCYTKPVARSGTSISHAGAHDGERGDRGLPAWSAPEQIDGAPADARTDVYGLGCLLVRALLGEDPPLDAARCERLAARLRRHAGKRLAAILERCLARAPEARWPSMPAFCEELDRAVARRWIK